MTARQIIKNQKGFTLIELLVVIGILAVLLAITLIAINPARQFAQANDTKRSSDVNTILNAINQYMADNHGNLPPIGAAGTVAIPVSPASPVDIGNGTGQVDLCGLVTTYLAALPSDPDGSPANSFNCQPVSGTIPAYDTKYTIVRSATDNRITVSAAGQLTPSIQVTR